jgi:hypothetical protein
VALLAAVTGHLAKGTKDEARALWNRHAPLLLPTTRQTFAVRLVEAHLAGRP